MLETLTGIGLATSAGLNAYIPLLAVGLLGRYTNLISLPGSWNWLENGWVLSILTVLLLIEFVADKIPVVDHVNDVIQTVVRPTAGGLAFGAASGAQTVTVDNPDTFFSGNQWVPIVAGIVISLVVHSAKAAIRPVVNVSTGGVGAPVVSTAEDVASASLSLVAILLPVLVIVFIVGFFWFFWVMFRKLRRWRAERKTRKTKDRDLDPTLVLPPR
ncbi:DUF4126 domain-containing protein [Luedemannella flava]|uniref:DUF4126 domain-containing protein n=1 Tax=Luedemannella flava TaxID=349316 RepID=A0ABP4YA47_9ACTN